MSLFPWPLLHMRRLQSQYLVFAAHGLDRQFSWLINQCKAALICLKWETMQRFLCCSMELIPKCFLSLLVVVGDGYPTAWPIFFVGIRKLRISCKCSSLIDAKYYRYDSKFDWVSHATMWQDDDEITLVFSYHSNTIFHLVIFHASVTLLQLAAA